MGRYLWIDTDEAYRDSSYAIDELKIEAGNFVTDLRYVPKSLIIKHKTFVLCGLVEFNPPLNPEGTGHYVAYCLTNTNWIERSDVVTYKKTLPINTPPIKITRLFSTKSTHLTAF